MDMVCHGENVGSYPCFKMEGRQINAVPGCLKNYPISQYDIAILMTGKATRNTFCPKDILSERAILGKSKGVI